MSEEKKEGDSNEEVKECRWPPWFDAVHSTMKHSKTSWGTTLLWNWKRNMPTWPTVEQHSHAAHQLRQMRVSRDHDYDHDDDDGEDDEVQQWHHVQSVRD